MDVLDHHPAAPETTPIKTYTPAMDLNPEQITVTPRSPSVLAAFVRTARVQTHHLVPALTDDSPSPVGQTPPPFRILPAKKFAAILLGNGKEEKEHTRKREKGHRISTPRPEPGRLRPPAPADAVRGLPPLLPLLQGGQAAAAAQTEERRRHTRTPLISRRLPPPAA